MLIEKIKLWEDDENSNLVTYVLDNSREFKTDQRRPAILVCPGGGYIDVSDREAEPIALRFAAEGYHTFVLNYNTYFIKSTQNNNSLPRTNRKSIYPGPLLDLAKAMMIIRENADKWFVDCEKISVCGFSAGAHLALSLGAHWQDELLKDKLQADSKTFKPNSLILGYPLTDYNIMKNVYENTTDKGLLSFFNISNRAIFGSERPTDEQLNKISPTNYITSNMVPTFIWHTATDGLIYVLNSLKLAEELTKHKIPYELHVFEEGPHGMSLCNEVTASEEAHIDSHCEKWIGLALEFLKKDRAKH